MTNPKATLNNMQRKLFDRITSGTEPLVIATGEGGAGKTFTIIHSILCLLHDDSIDNALVLAPTHQAKCILQQEMTTQSEHFGLIDQHTESLKATFSTVASALAKFGLTDADTGESFFIKNGMITKKMLKADLIYIDEFSMVSDGEANLLLFLIKNYPEKRFIFSGDPHQLNPVMDTPNSLLNRCPENEFRKFTVHLTEQMRAKGSPSIKQLCSLLRNDSLWSESVKFPNLDKLSKQSNGVKLYSNNNQLVDSIINFIDCGSFATQSFAYLTYTNSDADRVGSEIRSYLYDGVSDTEFIQGESFVLRTRIAGNASNAGNIGDIITIQRVLGYNTFVTLVGDKLRFAKVQLKGFSDKQSFNLLTLSASQNLSKALSNLSKQAYACKQAKDKSGQHTIVSQMMQLRDEFLKVSYPYSRTVHSSQGQTISHVFLDSNQLCGRSSQHRLFYVAVSRASDSLHIVPANHAFSPKKQKRAGKSHKNATDKWCQTFGYSNINARFIHSTVNRSIDSQAKLVDDIALADLRTYGSNPIQFRDTVIAEKKRIEKDWKKVVLPVYKEDSSRCLWEELADLGIRPDDYNALDEFMFTFL